jgi:2-polyprenyl-6-hydroxyphenyl methylase/3-demethylubiquinone-9 3-methyltransferase
MIVSTINRGVKSYALAVVAAEYLLGLLPKGTHDYAKFIRPSELGRWLRATGLDLEDLTGLTYHPLTRAYALDADDVSVNYMVCARRPGHA